MPSIYVENTWRGRQLGHISIRTYIVIMKYCTVPGSRNIDVINAEFPCSHPMSLNASVNVELGIFTPWENVKTTLYHRPRIKYLFSAIFYLIINIRPYILSFKHIISNKAKNINLLVNNRLHTSKMTLSKMLRLGMNPHLPPPSFATAQPWGLEKRRWAHTRYGLAKRVHSML